MNEGTNGMNEYAPVRTITKIEANPALTSRKGEYRKMRVAAYCRVSTDEEDQLNSLDSEDLRHCAVT